MTPEETSVPQRPYWLDAASLVKLVSDETEDGGAERVQRLVDGRGTFHTTWICVAVAYGLIKRRYFTKQPNKAQQETYYRKLYMLRNRIARGAVEVFTDWLQREDISPFNAIEVKDFARHHKIDFLDAIQIFEFRRGSPGGGADSQPPLLVTTDPRLTRAAGALDIAVWNPEKGEQPE